MPTRLLPVLDQGVSSLINFALTICVARVTEPGPFGQFSIAFAIFVFFLGLSRDVTGGVLLVAYGRSQRRRGRWERGPLGAGLILGGLSLVATVAVGLLLPGAGDLLLWIVMGTAIAVALQQDTHRYVAVATQRPGRALGLDAIWAVVAVPAMVVTSLTPGTTVLVVAEWALGAATAATVAAARAPLPSPAAGVRWLVANRRLSGVYTLEYTLLNGANLAIWFILVIPLTTTDLGALRGSLFLFSPLNPVFSAITLALLPDLVRAFSSDSFRRRVAVSGAVVTAAVGAYAVLVLLLPDAVGRAVLGPTWDAARDLRVPSAVHHTVLAAYTVLLVAFRASRDLRGSLSMRAAFAALTLLLPFALALALGPLGAATGLAAAAVVAVSVGLIRFAAADRTPSASHPVAR